MAEYVNLQQGELDEVCARLEEVHVSIFSAGSALYQEVLFLTGYGGGMYAELYSIRMQELMDVLNNTIAVMWNSVLLDEEAFCSAYVAKIKAVDTDGGGM